MKDFIIYESAYTSNVEIKKEETNGVRFIAILQEANKKNRNGRIYPKEVIQQGLDNPIIQFAIQNHTWFGEAGHPQSTDVSRQTTVDPNNLAFRIDKYWWEGDLLYGECLTTDTITGRNMAGLIRQGSKLSFSLRAQGKVENDPYAGAMVVRGPMLIICYDWVITPSHAASIMTQVCEATKVAWRGGVQSAMSLQESCNLYENGKLYEISAEEAERSIKDYVSSYGKSKNLYETYKYSNNDKVVSLSDDGSTMTIKNGSDTASVVTEDFLRQALRKSNILNETKIQNMEKKSAKSELNWRSHEADPLSTKEEKIVAQRDAYKDASRLEAKTLGQRASEEFAKGNPDAAKRYQQKGKTAKTISNLIKTETEKLSEASDMTKELTPADKRSALEAQRKQWTANKQKQEEDIEELTKQIERLKAMGQDPKHKNEINSIFNSAKELNNKRALKKQTVEALNGRLDTINKAMSLIDIKESFNKSDNRVERNQSLYNKRDDLLKKVNSGKMSMEDAAKEMNKKSDTRVNRNQAFYDKRKELLGRVENGSLAMEDAIKELNKYHKVNEATELSQEDLEESLIDFLKDKKARMQKQKERKEIENSMNHPIDEPMSAETIDNLKKETEVRNQRQEEESKKVQSAYDGLKKSLGMTDQNRNNSNQSPEDYFNELSKRDEEETNRTQKEWEDFLKKDSFRESLEHDNESHVDILNNLRKDIQDEYDAIIGYEKHAYDAREAGYDDLANTLEDIRNEEKVHIGELQAQMKKLDPNFEKSLDDGEEEVKNENKPDNEGEGE